jgi:4-hydroxy-tetrahydrodipicolinate reductase
MTSSPVWTVVSGIPGKLAVAIAEGVEADAGTELVGVYNPGRAGDWNGVRYLSELPEGAQVVVEAGPDHTVMDNLRQWRRSGAAVVVGTSGFTSERIDVVRNLWQGAERACLIVPNFAIGAVLSMRFAELAARHFVTTEVIERHRAGKPDAPSGTALQTAARIAAGGGRSAPKTEELVRGSLGGSVDGVRVHSLRLEGLLSHQEVAMTNPGEQFSIVHQSTSYDSFAAGAVAAVKGVLTMSGVAVGLDRVLGLE